MDLQEKNKRRESFWPGAAPQPACSCGGLAACPVARKTGARSGELGGIGARLQLVEGLTGLAVRGTPGTPPQDVPPGIGMGMVSCIPMPVLVQWGREAPGAG